MILQDLLKDYADELIKQVDIKSVIRKTVDLKEVGSAYIGKCPFCGGKLQVDKEKQNYRCDDCGENGNFIRFIDEKMRLDMKKEEKDSEKPFMKESFEILKEVFPDLKDEEYRELFSSINGFLRKKIVTLCKNKSYISYRDGDRFLKDFRFLCEFMKREQEIEEDMF